MKKILGIVVLLFLSMHVVFSQDHQTTDNSAAWFMYTGNHKFANKWGVHLEAQMRRANFIAHPQQLFFRAGLMYHINNQIHVTAGYAFAETYPYGEFAAKATFPENRIWEQLQIKNQLNSTEWVSRFRLEQRFNRNPVLVDGSYTPGDAVYTNRFRLNNKFSIPFKGKTIEDKSLYMTFSDEFFINFGGNVKMNFLDQNRAMVGLGYRIPAIGRLEVGYMLQTIFKSDGIKIEHDHTLVVGLSSNISFQKKKK